MEKPIKPILLVIQDTLPISLTPELDLYRQDLEREGWTVDTCYVPARQTKPPYTAHQDAGLHVWSWLTSRFGTELPHVVLIGAVPVPNTGIRYTLTEMSIDAGCHQCSAYYALPDLEWTDLADNSDWKSAGKPYLATNRTNTPGDGNFDQEIIPGGIPIRAAVGVIDFSTFNPKAWGSTESAQTFQIGLYRQYFRRLHSYRIGSEEILTRVAQGDFKPPAGAGFREWAFSLLDASGDYAEFVPALNVVEQIRKAAPFGIFQDLKLLNHSESVWRNLTYDRTVLFAVLSLSFGSGQATADRPRIANAFAAGALCASSSIFNWNLTPLFEGRTVGECWVNTLHNNRRGLHLVLRGCPAVTLKF